MLLLGGSCVASGVAYYLRLCPLFTGVVLGIVFANTAQVKEKVYGFLQAREKDIYVVMLILAGVLWNPKWFWILALAPAFVLARAAGKVLGFWACSRPIVEPDNEWVPFLTCVLATTTRWRGVTSMRKSTLTSLLLVK